MKTGVIIWCADGTQNGGHKYVDKLDLDYAEGADVAKKGILTTDDNQAIYVDFEGKVIGNNNNTKASNGDKVKLHLYGADGARKTGANNVEFADDTYVLQTSGNLGDKGSGYFGKKYYSLGIQLKASTDLRYGIYTKSSPSSTDRTSSGGKLHPQAQNADDLTTWYNELNDGNYQVLTTGGSKVKANANGKKDADGNYWLIGQGDALQGIWTQNVSYGKSFSTTWKTRKVQAQYWGTMTRSTAQLEAFGLAIEGANPAIDDRVWDAHYQDGAMWFTPATKINNVYSFQSDYDGGSNKWLPMGLTDDSNKTCAVPSVCAAGTVTDSAAHSYEVKPTNDYFLNCYWLAN